MFSHLCNKLVSSHVLLFFFPKCVIKMPLTKTKKIHRELRKNTRKRRWTCERRREEDRRGFFYGVKFILEKYHRERRVFALFVYLLKLFIFDQLKFMYLCFIRIFRYSYYHEEAGPISNTSTKIIITINNRNKNNEDQFW